MLFPSEFLTSDAKILHNQSVDVTLSPVKQLDPKKRRRNNIYPMVLPMSQRKQNFKNSTKASNVTEIRPFLGL